MMPSFSHKYIQLVTNSKLIQALWRKRGPRVGDWFLNADDAIETVVDFSMQPDGSWIIFYTYKHDPQFVPSIWSCFAAEVTWLPSTDDLLEQLGKRIGTGEIEWHANGMWYAKSFYGGMKGEGKSILITLARLLERALEEGEEK